MCARLLALVAIMLASCAGHGGDQAGSDSTVATSGATPSPGTKAEPASPTTASAVTTAPSPSPATLPAPLVAGEFDFEVPAVDGFTYNVTPAAPIPWSQLALPDKVEGFAFGVKAAGDSIGSLVIVDDFGLARHLDRMFDEPVLIQRDTAPHGDQVLVLTNEARAVWRPFGGVPVVAATVPDGDVGQWVWGHDGLIWIAVGSLAMEDYVTGLVAQQQAALPADTYDYQLLAGPLHRRWLTEVPGYTFVDLPVSATLDQIPNTLSGDCAQRLYLGHVAPVDDPDPSITAPHDLALTAATIGGVCKNGGFFDHLDAALDAIPNMRDDVIAGIPVRRNESHIVAVNGDDVIHLYSDDPATLVEMEPFITVLLTRQRQPEIVDFNTLTVGTCLFRGAPRSNDPEDRPVYVTDCATPHHGEVFHGFTLDWPQQAAYPGDTAVSTIADQGCVDAFAGYVGIDYPSSRLNYLYLYPSAETWATGDRGVQCILYGSDPEELLRGSTAQTGQ